jgi:hypothetical protein
MRAGRKQHGGLYRMRHELWSGERLVIRLEAKAK